MESLLSPDLAQRASAAITCRQTAAPPRFWKSIGLWRILYVPIDERCNRLYGVNCHNPHGSALRTLIGALSIAAIFAIASIGIHRGWPPAYSFLALAIPAVWFAVLDPYFRACAVWKAHALSLRAREPERQAVADYLEQLGQDLRAVGPAEDGDEDVEDDVPELRWLDVELRAWEGLTPLLLSTASDDASAAAIRASVVGCAEDCERAWETLQRFVLERECFFLEMARAHSRLGELFEADGLMPKEDDIFYGMRQSADSAARRAIGRLQHLLSAEPPTFDDIGADEDSEPSFALVWQWWRDFSRLNRVQPFAGAELERLQLLVPKVLQSLDTGFELIRRHRE